jgi:gluconate 2-dehydrogenase gamma chain
MIRPDEFAQLQEPWDPKMLEIAEERMRSNYRRDKLEHFQDVALTMKAALDRLIPQAEDPIDLVGFIDGRIHDPIGRGDRQPGMPDEREAIRIGLEGLDETAQALHTKHFKDLEPEQQDAILRMVQRDQAPGESWRRVPGSYFFERFYNRALAGFYAHPRVWMRIGFYGASYPEGYAWLGKAQVKQRHDRTPGWDRL